MQADTQGEKDAQGKEQVGRDLNSYCTGDCSQELGKGCQGKRREPYDEPQRSVFFTQHFAPEHLKNNHDYQQSQDEGCEYPHDHIPSVKTFWSSRCEGLRVSANSSANTDRPR